LLIEKLGSGAHPKNAVKQRIALKRNASALKLFTAYEILPVNVARSGEKVAPTRKARAKT
jgi:hypothetical protein